MKVLVCGDRNWRDASVIARRLKELPSGSTIIHGAARGADYFGGAEAEFLGFYVRTYPAQWERYGRAAGMRRNQQMLDEEAIDLVLAFHADIEHSKGTKDMVTRARKANIVVEVITG